MAMRGRLPFLRTVAIRNFKSIGECRVDLAPFTVLVGRNSSGKSNFLDALRFVSDALQTTLDHAIKSRGGIKAVRRRSTGHPRNFGIELQLTLDDSRFAIYGFEIAAETSGGFCVKQERLRITQADGLVVASYHVESGSVVSCSEAPAPKATKDRLFLVAASGLDPFRRVFDALSAMGFYNLNPEAMKELQNPDAGELLHRDGANIAGVVARLEAEEPEASARLTDYLKTIVPGMVGVERATLGPKETLEFRQDVQGSKYPWRFYAMSVSDGTLRALGILTAVMQLVGRDQPIPLVGIEEPETALHPAAAGSLMEALREASQHTQIIVTSHSGVLLDELDLDENGLLVVTSRQGRTQIAPPDAASTQSIREHLYTAGELQRLDQLDPDPESLARQSQMNLFESLERVDG